MGKSAALCEHGVAWGCLHKTGCLLFQVVQLFLCAAINVDACLSQRLWPTQIQLSYSQISQLQRQQLFVLLLYSCIHLQ